MERRSHSWTDKRPDSGHPAGLTLARRKPDWVQLSAHGAQTSKKTAATQSGIMSAGESRQAGKQTCWSCWRMVQRQTQQPLSWIMFADTSRQARKQTCCNCTSARQLVRRQQKAVGGSNGLPCTPLSSKTYSLLVLVADIAPSILPYCAGTAQTYPSSTTHPASKPGPPVSPTYPSSTTHPASTSSTMLTFRLPSVLPDAMHVPSGWNSTVLTPPPWPS